LADEQDEGDDDGADGEPEDQGPEGPGGLQARPKAARGHRRAVPRGGQTTKNPAAQRPRGSSLLLMAALVEQGLNQGEWWRLGKLLG
jgi:hypothetical protein